MCLNPECKWITIIEDDKSGEKCYIHYKFSEEDGTFVELFTEGDKSLKIYVEMMRDNKHFEPKDYPRPEVPHYDNTYFINGTFDVSGHNGGHESHCNNYASSIAISPYNPIVMDFAGNLFNINDLNMTIDLTDIIDLNEPEEPTIPTIQNQKNPNYKSSNGF
jgi:hypothetical protein